MSEPKQIETQGRSAGYGALIQRFGLDVLPNWHRSYIGNGVSRLVDRLPGGIIREEYPSVYWPGDGVGLHLEFALKYDGTNLGILKAVFDAASADEVSTYIKSRPVGKYARRIWFLYEYLTGSELPIEDLKKGNYVDLLDPNQYYTSSEIRKIRRQRIRDNLLGDVRFCPVVRRTETLKKYETANLSQRCRELMETYNSESIRRASAYLYTKETKSSFEIEHIKPDSGRTERFVAMLQLAEREDFCEKSRLIDLQNRTVDPRFADQDFRNTQNYVGEAVSWGKERIHYVSPKPEDLPLLMDGLMAAHLRMENGLVPAPIHAAVISFGFVFLHPFEDGNGRIHRFLIHNILARRGFTPQGIIFPISASMLNRLSEYDACLEAFSRPILQLVEYTLDDEGRMSVHNDSRSWYAYIDFTVQVEALFRFVEDTIDTELPKELLFLASYDRTCAAIREIIDMPDRQIDRFIMFCLQNSGNLSSRKRSSHFPMLSDEEVDQLERAVQEGYADYLSRRLDR